MDFQTYPVQFNGSREYNDLMKSIRDYDTEDILRDSPVFVEDEDERE